MHSWIPSTHCHRLPFTASPLLPPQQVQAAQAEADRRRHCHPRCRGQAAAAGAPRAMSGPRVFPMHRSDWHDCALAVKAIRIKEAGGPCSGRFVRPFRMHASPHLLPLCRCTRAAGQAGARLCGAGSQGGQHLARGQALAGCRRHRAPGGEGGDEAAGCRLRAWCSSAVADSRRAPMARLWCCEPGCPLWPAAPAPPRFSACL